jgi:hypothetical protein
MIDAVATWLCDLGFAVMRRCPFTADVPMLGDDVAKAVAEVTLKSEADAIETSFVAAATQTVSLLRKATPPVARSSIV